MLRGCHCRVHRWQRITKKWVQGLASSPRQKYKVSSQARDQINVKADGQEGSERVKQDDDSTSKFIKIFALEKHNEYKNWLIRQWFHRIWIQDKIAAQIRQKQKNQNYVIPKQYQKPWLKALEKKQEVITLPAGNAASGTLYTRAKNLDNQYESPQHRTTSIPSHFLVQQSAPGLN